MVPGANESGSSHGNRVWGAGQSASAASGARANWDDVKVKKMLDVNRAKYAQHAECRAELLATGNLDIEFKGASTSWVYKGETHYWQRWNAIIQMLIREELKVEYGAHDEELRAELQRLVDEYSAPSPSPPPGVLYRQIEQREAEARELQRGYFEMIKRGEYYRQFSHGNPSPIISQAEAAITAKHNEILELTQQYESRTNTEAQVARIVSDAGDRLRENTNSNRARAIQAFNDERSTNAGHSAFADYVRAQCTATTYVALCQEIQRGLSISDDYFTFAAYLRRSLGVWQMGGLSAALSEEERWAREREAEKKGGGGV